MNAVVKTESLPARRMDIDTQALASKALEMGTEGVEALERVLALAERERDYHARCAYDDAMLAVQSEMPRIFKDGHNPDNRSRFPRLENVDRHLRPLYTQHGFRITFSTEPCEQPGWITHVGTVTHTGGHVETIRMPLPIDSKGPKGGPTKTEMHGVGSAMSYAQRRITIMAFGAVATGEDDDAAAAAPPVEMVTDSQAADLQALAEEVGADTDRFFAFMSKRVGADINLWSEIPAAEHLYAVQALEARRKAASR